MHDDADVTGIDIADRAVLRRIELPGGGRLVIREMRVGDAPAVGRLYESLDLDDRHRRFFSAHHPSPADLVHWCTIGDRGGYGVVALVADGGPDAGSHGGDDDWRLVGEAGYVPVADGSGEFALTVASGWRGWLGPMLLDLLVEEAARRGVANLEADILFDNRPMLALVRSRGYVTIDSAELGIVHVLIATAGRTPSWPPHGTRPRLLVETAGGRWQGTGAANAVGFTVVSCGGLGVGRHCPALDGRPCPLVEQADAIVVAMRPDDPRAEALVAEHRHARPELTIVVQPLFELPPGEAVPEGASPTADPATCRLAARTPTAELLELLAASVRRERGTAGGGDGAADPDDPVDPVDQVDRKS